jgi:adenosylhomocysteine nucleosidase
VIAFITAMPSEMKPLARLLPAGTPKAVSGMGTALATTATQRLLDKHPQTTRVVMVGIAGGLRGTEIGQVIVPETVLDRATGRRLHPEPIGGHVAHGTIATGDDLLMDDAEIARLESAGVVALDMETAAVGTVCEERRVPWSVFRGISDRPSDGMVDDAVFRMAKPDGSPNFAAVLRYVVTHPHKMPMLARLGRDLNTATKAAAEAAVAAVR